MTLAACLVALAGFGAGQRQQDHVRVLSGLAYVGSDQVSVVTSDQVYAVPLDVTWVDSHGSTHDSGRPACLTGIRSRVRITFGEVPVVLPDGQHDYRVVWVDC